jgi:hypothetical protein
MDQSDVQKAIELFRAIQAAEGALWEMKKNLTELLNKLSQSNLKRYMEEVKE